MGTTIDSNLDITIKNKLYDVDFAIHRLHRIYSDPARVDSTKRIL
jgi:hypothetical protein